MSEPVTIPAPRKMKPLRWTTNAEQSAYMRERVAQNRAATLANTSENWMARKLATTEHKWTRQAQWGYRIFDFWCHALGIAIEVDGPEHRKDYDAYRDEYNYRRSGILVLRVRNSSEKDAEKALQRISEALPWKDRRAALGLNAHTKKERRQHVSG